MVTKTILTENQHRILSHLSQVQDITDNFYLSGGTALAEYYLHHRYSEDLDFFSYEEIDPMVIHIVLKRISKSCKIKSIDFQRSFNRNLFFLHLEKEQIKTEFTYYPFPQIEKPTILQNLKIDSILDIAINKVFTIYQNPRSRDFIDLYCIMKDRGWEFADLRIETRKKFDTLVDPLQLAQQLLKVKELKDYPHMIIDIREKEWQSFFLKIIDDLKKDVLE